ncbi:glycine/betaine ABC transporter [Cohnella sp. CIP 111063]|uniref:ABC transporter permease n=1 Tax=unclassified Cohnella TaxID=2636738 RepID=UPI000B8C4ACB|nr:MULTISPECIES: proline/glycine betaine ABC transporter permease [unclassified Cohnella]OXS56622.1 glycine/betaine ABC transporter [Cohnella sp. CIP 111063]
MLYWLSALDLPKIPIGKWVEAIEKWLEGNAGPVFQGIKAFIGTIVNGLADGFNAVPPLLLIVLFTGLAYWIGRTRIAVFTLLGLYLVYNLGYWENTMETLALVLTASIISIVIGIPLGIACARSDKVQKVVTPVLDFMQTMPAFVYLLPAVAFFSLGVVPGVIASVIFGIPPTIRLTNLGIRQVPADLVEAADAFGSTPLQKLFKLQLPIAAPTIMAGVNQTIMLSLSMVVIASMIGAQGVGADVYRAVTQAKTGVGFEAGLAVVVLAIILDRITQNLVKTKRKGL